MILAAPGPRARPKHAVPPGSFAEPSCQKIAFDLQLTNLAVQKIDLRLADRSLCRRAAAPTVSTMSSMLDTLLDINQLEAGIVRREMVGFPINAVLEQLRTQFTFQAAARHLGWRVVPSSLRVHSDPHPLEQMIRNLLSNAVKYTNEGKILLGCPRRGDKVRIEVWDSGIGIPEEELEAIFGEFHQLDNPARERSKGLGLGLAIVERLADLLGHTVDVRSVQARARFLRSRCRSDETLRRGRVGSIAAR